MHDEMGYIVAKGPEELTKALNEILETSQKDSQFKASPHFVLYELGHQKSMIKMDTSEWPVIFWHYDLLGRPATTTVKDVLARFSWEKCGEKEWYFKEKGVTEQDVMNSEYSLEDAFLDWKKCIFDEKNH